MDISKLKRPRTELTLYIYIPLSILCLTLYYYMPSIMMDFAYSVSYVCAIASLVFLSIGFKSVGMKKTYSFWFLPIKQIGLYIGLLATYSGLDHVYTHHSISESLWLISQSNQLKHPLIWFSLLTFALLFAWTQHKKALIPSAQLIIKQCCPQKYQQDVGLSINTFMRQASYASIAIITCLWTYVAYTHVIKDSLQGLSIHTLIISTILIGLLTSHSWKKMALLLTAYRVPLGICLAVVSAIFIILAGFITQVVNDFDLPTIVNIVYPKLTVSLNIGQLCQFLIPYSLLYIIALDFADDFKGRPIWLCMLLYSIVPLGLWFMPTVEMYFLTLHPNMSLICLTSGLLFLFGYMFNHPRTHQFLFKNDFLFGFSDKDRSYSYPLSGLLNACLIGSFSFMAGAISMILLVYFVLITPAMLGLVWMALAITQHIRKRDDQNSYLSSTLS